MFQFSRLDRPTDWLTVCVCVCRQDRDMEFVWLRWKCHYIFASTFFIYLMYRFFTFALFESNAKMGALFLFIVRGNKAPLFLGTFQLWLVGYKTHLERSLNSNFHVKRDGPQDCGSVHGGKTFIFATCYENGLNFPHFLPLAETPHTIYSLSWILKLDSWAERLKTIFSFSCLSLFPVFFGEKNHLLSTHQTERVKTCSRNTKLKEPALSLSDFTEKINKNPKKLKTLPCNNNYLKEELGTYKRRERSKLHFWGLQY